MTQEVDLLLEAWETSACEHPIRRSLALLAALRPQRSEAEWARVPIGERDATLLELQEALFGSALSTVARCPGCGERLESSFLASDLRAGIGPADRGEPLRLASGGYDVRFRLPNSEDLLLVAGAPPEEAPRDLLRRCTLEVRRGEDLVPDADLPSPLAAEMARRMADADPNADIRLRLDCPACGHRWSAVFDIVSHLWSEIDDWAQALLADVHELAGAYGWSERDVLAMSPVRRQFYLDLVQR